MNIVIINKINKKVISYPQIAYNINKINNIVSSTNLTKGKVDDFLKKSIDIVNAFDSPQNLTELVLDLQFLTKEACRILGCHSN